MANNSGSLVGKVIVSVLVTILTLVTLACLFVLIYGGIKGLNFSDSFNTIFSFLGLSKNIN